MRLPSSGARSVPTASGRSTAGARAYAAASSHAASGTAAQLKYATPQLPPLGGCGVYFKNRHEKSSAAKNEKKHQERL